VAPCGDHRYFKWIGPELDLPPDQWRLSGFTRDIFNEIEMETGLTIVTKPIPEVQFPNFGLWPEGMANDEYDAFLAPFAWQTTYANPLEVQRNFVFTFPVYSGIGGIMTLKTFSK
jgi:hypothetical protein